jgi:hypothetical protein
LDLVKKNEKEEGEQIEYFDADLVNSEGLILQTNRNISFSREINMVTTIFYNSYDEDEEEFTEEEGEDTDCEDPEYGNLDLKYMKNRVRHYLRITQ